MMCVMSTPKMETPVQAPKMQEFSAADNTAASREMQMRRRRAALGRGAAFSGAMQGAGAAQGKTKLGQ